MKTRKIYLVSLLLAATMATACEEWLKIEPEYEITDTDLYKNTAGYYKVVNGLYRQMSDFALYGKELSWGMTDVWARYYAIDPASDYKSYPQMYDLEYEAKEAASLASAARGAGDPVYAIGNPLGVELRGTLTDGIVSAINRDVDVDGVTMTLIQTNAALNNGNSGGPLINRYGQVIGINVMKMGMDRWSTASVEGLGFAIPIASSAYIVNDILRCGEVQGEPVLGISVDRTPAYLPDGQQAARVYTVDLNGPGDKAGLEVDDLIYEADGVRVETSNDLLRVRHRHAAGEEMILKVCRGGEYLTVSVTLEAKK